jgi:hypothetical protein
MTDACPARPWSPVRVADDGWCIPRRAMGAYQAALATLQAPLFRVPQPARLQPQGHRCIFFVLRTTCPWGALDATGICSHSAAHRRFQV